MMRPLVLALVLSAVACSGRGEPEASAPPPQEAGRAPSPQEQARAIAADPRLLLFDLQTALETAHQSSGSYPSTTEFRLDDRWSLQRSALDAAFSSWEYRSDGTSYELSGEAGGRRISIASPS